jgi:hypothetical protein
MKRLMVAVAVIGGILHGQGAFAKTLEDVLKEKGGDQPRRLQGGDQKPTGRVQARRRIHLHEAPLRFGQEKVATGDINL